MKKRILNVLLTALLVVTFVPAVCGAEDDLFRYEVDFEDFNDLEKSTPGEVLYATSTRLGNRHFQAMYAVNSSRVIRFPKRTHGKNGGSEDMVQAYKNEKAADGPILDGPQNTICIEDGKFKIKRNWDYSDVRYFAFRIFYSQDNYAPLVNGGVRVKFDFSIDSEMAANAQLVKWMIFGKEFGADLFRLSIDGSKLYLSPGDDNTWNNSDYLLTSEFKTGETYTLDLVLNLDAHKVNVSLNGVDCGIKSMSTNQSQFGWIQIANVKPAGATEFNYSLDNLLFEKLPSPKIVSTNITDGAEGVDLTAPEIEFNMPLHENSVKGLSLYAFDEKVEDAVFELSEDKTKAYLVTPLDYSTLYTVKADSNVIAENRLTAIPAQFSFHTKHKSPNLTITEEISFDKTSLVSGDTVTASAKFKNDTENSEDIILIAALYNDKNRMEKIVANKITVPSGDELSNSVSIQLPEAVDGKVLRVYAWDSYGNVHIAAASNSLK